MRIAIDLDGTELTKSLNQINREMKAAQAQYKAGSAGMDKYKKSTKELQFQKESLMKVLKTQAERSSVLKTQWEEEIALHGENSKKAKQLEKAYYDSITAMKKTENALIQVNDALANQPKELSKVEKGLVSAGDKFNKLGDDLGKLSSKFMPITKAFAGLATVAIGSAVAIGTQSLKEFAKFETGMNEVFTLLPGITKDSMDAMGEEVKKFSKDFTVLPEKVVPALYQSLSAGVPKDNVFEFLEIANKAAVGGVTDLDTAVNGITSVINAYGTDVLSAAQASDQMFTAVRLGKFCSVAGKLAA